ncbi:glucose-6-phosphate isomerase family protein [Zobellia uliginosa]|uniref:glucose-6-phosphate isomerase family protein n=1 Tax=Zobellia uliginosa TaxID=143224 RepID=UPI0026E3EFC9|nr:glucose-6-phosphate isomerase family protein [Zobellia uliginosa]MDO6517764.1 glucose-6-phosphate isomerase family protein [Zobellia uliginosa]
MEKLNPGFDIVPHFDPLGFEYGKNCFGPKVEHRSLNSIRPSLRDPRCHGPEIVYAIAMDVGKNEHRELLQNRHLLYGAVIYAAGNLGDEPIRSQGHIHQQSTFAQGWSTPEVYEIWSGKAVIYMQETANDNPGRCYAVHAMAGEVVIVPPGWAHATISADPNEALSFGAWCDRDYGFEYDQVREHQGLAWYPILKSGKLDWQYNARYKRQKLIEKSPEKYADFGLIQNTPIYTQFENCPKTFDFVSRPDKVKGLWNLFLP